MKPTGYIEQLWCGNVWCTQISSLLGITTAPLRYISEWMSGGDLNEYVEEYPWPNRLGRVGDLLLQAAHY